MKLKHIIIALVILAILGLTINRVFSNKKANNNKQNSKKEIVTVQGIVTKYETFSNELNITGSIEANENVAIYSEVSGIVENISFTEGSFVKKGQLLLKVNDIELRAQLAQATTREKLARENYRRAGLLLEKEAISQEEYDVSYTEMQAAIAQTQLIQAQIAKSRIIAPFDGQIGLRHISPGAYVTPSTLITQLTNSNPVKITFSVPEKYVQQLKKESIIHFTVSGNKTIFEGKVYAIEPMIDASTRTLQLRALTDNKDGQLIPGTFANILLSLEENNDAILIPTEAIIPIQNGKKIFLYKNGKAEERIITTGTRTDKDVLVLEGLTAGDTVLTSGVMSLRNGTPIQVKISQ